MLRAFVEVANAAAGFAVRDAETAYRLGGGPLIDVTRAHRTLGRARRALVQAQGQRLADLVRVYAATAADWRVAIAPDVSRPAPAA